MSHARFLLILVNVALFGTSCATTAKRQQLSGTCEVHGIPLMTGTAPVASGYLITDPRYAEAEPKSFPHADTSVRGGCIVGPDRDAVVQYCPRCREAKAKFSATLK